MAKRTITHITIILFLVISTCTTVAYAQNRNSIPNAAEDSTSRKVIHYAGIDFSPSYVCPTNKFFKGDNSLQKPLKTSFSTHLKYGFRFGKDTFFGKMYPYSVQGIGVSWNTFLNKTEVGTPVALYVFQTSRIASLAGKLSLDYEWNFGASFGWKPFDEESNPANLVVGSRINAYINLGLLLNWQLAPSWNLRAGAGFTHYSNGNTSYPNAGVNTIGGRIGLTRSFGHEVKPEVPSPRRKADGTGFRPYVSYDLIVYGALRKKAIIWEDGTVSIAPGSFAIVGLNFNPMYNFNRYFRAGLSLDAQFDESANIKDHIANDYIPADDLKFHRPPFMEQFAVGLSVRAEIVMPIFSINLGIGRNILCKGDDTSSFYQTFVLKTDITKNIFLHVGYQLYRFKEPNNLMIGLGYRFNARAGK